MSLFLTWSHQLPSRVLAAAGGSAALRGVPPDPTGWQVYSVADVLLAALALALVATALAARSRRVRIGLLVVLALAVAFTLHALGAPPTSGVLLIDPAAATARYLPDAAGAGVGETVALVSLGVAALGLSASLVRD